MDRQAKSSSVLGTSPKGQWLGAKGGGSKLPSSGVEIMKRLNEGMLNRTPTKHIQEVKDRVSEACEELISVGARIRPLLVDGRPAGWVRGLHDTERRLLRRWVLDPNEFVFRCLLLTTSLGEEEVVSLSSLEVRRLVQLVMAMGDRDMTLFPYLSAFSTTRTSEGLWHSGGSIASFDGKEVMMPDGRAMRIMRPSDHARLWASLCTYREQAKKRLDESWNAVLIIRPWAGKSVDGLSAELKAATKAMRADALEPWENMVQAPVDKDLDDGWAHSENMETNEGMLKELHGMLANDRHERLMDKFEQQQVMAAERRRLEIEGLALRRRADRGEEVVRVETEEAVLRREAELRQGRVGPAPVGRDKASGGTPRDLADKLRKYQ